MDVIEFHNGVQREAEMVFRVYSNSADEILIFDAEGNGEEDFFEGDGRARDDYDMILCEPPFIITSSVRLEADKEHR